MVLPYRSKNPPESFPFACLTLIIVNVVLFAATCDGWSIRRDVAMNFGLTANNASLKTFISSMFMHGDWLHLAGNMWFLYLFGWAVEGRMKAPKFLLAYFLAGFAGSGLHMMLTTMGKDVPLIGASGAIMGVMGMALRAFPHAQIDVFYAVGGFGMGRVGTTTWKMYGVAAMYFFMDLLYGLLFLNVKGGGGVAHFAHVGGVLAGVVLGFIFVRHADAEEVSDAKATVAETKDYSTLWCQQLEDLYRVTPDDPLLVHTWMWRALRDNKLKPECVDAFERLLPKISTTEDSATLGGTLNMFHAAMPERAPLGLMIRLATDLEKNANPQLATTLTTAAIHNPRIGDEDCRAGVLLIAKIQEQWFKQYPGALQYYTYFLQRWPMDPMEGFVKERVKVAEAKIAEQQASGQASVF